jgi:hypothetical protein
MKMLTPSCYISDDEYVACARLDSGRSAYICKEGANIVCETFEEAKQHVRDYEKLMSEFMEVFKK